MSHRAAVSRPSSRSRARKCICSGRHSDDEFIAQRIAADGCTVEHTSLTPAERDGVTVHATYTCASAPKSVRLDFLDELPPVTATSPSIACCTPATGC